MSDDQPSGPPRSLAEAKKRIADGGGGSGGGGRMRLDARRADDAELGRLAAERSRLVKEARRGGGAPATARAPAAERADAAPTGPVRSLAEMRRRIAAGLR